MPTPAETKFNKLQQLINLVNEGMSKDDFVKAFETVVSVIKQIQKSNAQEIALMHQSIDLLSKKVAADSAGHATDFKKQILAIVDGILADHGAKMSAIDEKLAILKDGEPGKKGDPGEPGKNGSPDTGLQIRDKLESLQGDERLDIGAIRGLSEAITALIPAPSRTIFGPGKTKIVRVDLSDLLDGVTKTFPLGTHFGIISVDSSSSPFGAFRELQDYNEVGKDIVFTDNVDATISLAKGQNLIVKILK